MPGRGYTAEDQYRYGFNAQEKTPEIAPNTFTAKYWEYDARIVRRWNVDPKPNVSISPYNCFAGNPILYFDQLGDTIRTRGDQTNRDEFIKILEARTGNMYKVDTKGNLIRTNKNSDTKYIERKTSFTLGLLIDNAIKKKKDIVFDFTADGDIKNNEVFLDQAMSNLIDVSDWKRITNEPLQAALLGHLVNERSIAAELGVDFSDRKQFNKYFEQIHKDAIKTESIIMALMTGSKYAERKERWKPMGQTGKITFTYGERIFKVFVIADGVDNPTGEFDSDFEPQNYK